LVVVVEVGDCFVDVPVLLRGAGRVELLKLESLLDDRLKEVQRPDGVGHHGLVGPMPGFADVSLSTEVEDVMIVRGLAELADEVIDRGAVGQVRKMNLEAPT